MFCSSTTSIRRNTPAAPSPIPAAPAMPSMVRGRVQRPGSSVTAASPTRRMIAETMVSTSAGEQTRGQREQEHDDGLEQAELDRTPRRSTGTSVGRNRRAASAAESCRLRAMEEVPKYTGRPRGRPRAVRLPTPATTATSVTAQARERPVHPALMVRGVEPCRRPGRQGTSTARPREQPRAPSAASASVVGPAATRLACPPRRTERRRATAARDRRDRGSGARRAREASVRSPRRVSSSS